MGPSEKSSKVLFLPSRYKKDFDYQSLIILSSKFSDFNEESNDGEGENDSKDLSMMLPASYRGLAEQPLLI